MVGFCGCRMSKGCYSHDGGLYSDGLLQLPEFQVTARGVWDQGLLLGLGSGLCVASVKATCLGLLEFQGVWFRVTAFRAFEGPLCKDVQPPPKKTKSSFRNTT